MKIFKRKITERLQDWKNSNKDRHDRAFMIEGARGVGKTTVVKEFAERNYDSCILIDFSRAKDDVKDLFSDLWHPNDAFYEKLEAMYNVKLVPGRSVIIFDAVRHFMRARECIEFLVQDGKYDFIETGSLQGICIGIDKIKVPGREHSVTMYPMDFEEFLWALHGNDNAVTEQIKAAYDSLTPLGPEAHSLIMNDFRKYMLVGGMPKAVSAFLEGAEDGFNRAETAKQMILSDFFDDIREFGGTDKEKERTVAVFKEVPQQLTERDKCFDATRLDSRARADEFDGEFYWLIEAGLVNRCCLCDKPDWLLSINLGEMSSKYYMADTGMLVTWYYFVNKKRDLYLHYKVLNSDIGVYENMLLENMVAQMLAPTHKRWDNQYFYRHYDRAIKTTDMGADFIIYGGKRTRICPVEVKAGEGRNFETFDRMKSKYDPYIRMGCVLHTGDVAVKDDVIFLPVYMAMLL